MIIEIDAPKYLEQKLKIFLEEQAKKFIEKNKKLKDEKNWYKNWEIKKRNYDVVDESFSSADEVINYLRNK